MPANLLCGQSCHHFHKEACCRQDIILDWLFEECCRTGWKTSTAKFKTKTCPGTNPRVECSLPILGGWVEQQLTFYREVQYLIEQTKAQLSNMKALPGKYIETRHSGIRSFYIHLLCRIGGYAPDHCSSCKISSWFRMKLPGLLWMAPGAQKLSSSIWRQIFIH